MVWNVVLVLVSFGLLLGGAVLFTNAVEWLGARLGLGHGPVGSVLAAVATALPESVIPVVAILAGQSGGQIAIGAIIGAPFLLGTLGMAVVGLSALGFRRRRAQGTRLRIDQRATRRDLFVFVPVLATAVLLGIVGNRVVHIVAAILFVLCYVAYAWRTVERGRESTDEENLGELYFNPRRGHPPRTVWIALQVVVGVGLIVGGAQLFVTEVESLGHAVGVPALVLALVLAPLASELPEKLNSVLWVRRDKDALALGNITGAMVFQATIPVAFGLAFVNWQLETPALVAAGCGLAGALLCLAVVRRSPRFSVGLVLAWLALYLGAVVCIVVTGT
jgi:cation:H+ antiporter